MKHHHQFFQSFHFSEILSLVYEFRLNFYAFLLNAQLDSDISVEGDGKQNLINVAQEGAASWEVFS